MKYLELKKQLNNFIIFTTIEIRKFELDFDTRRLSEWQNKGYIKKIRRGFYMFADLELNEPTLFVIANKIYNPSYVSFEMAFAYYNLIPESVYSITLASSQKTTVFNTQIGNFVYHKLKPELMFGYKLVNYKNYNFKMAEIEKAILDYFYINTHLTIESDFQEIRFNRERFLEQVNRKKLKQYLKAFNNNLAKRMEKFLTYVDTQTN